MPRGHDGHSKRGHRMRESRRILVVEDDFLVARLLAEILESVGWQVVGPVAHLAAALNAAASESFDAAVLDVNLAGQTVYPVAKVLDARRVPFAFVTAYGREALPPLFCRRPHLAKPFVPGELIDTVARLIGRAAEAEALLVLGSDHPPEQVIREGRRSYVGSPRAADRAPTIS
jgi:CheY-like chemotaxis protein